MTQLNAMTVDVEDYFHVTALADAIPREQWERLDSRVVESTNRLLDLFDETGTRATFFILGWVTGHHPALVRRIHDRGHEIGCHGLSHQMIYRQSPDEFRDETLRAKRMLEDVTGRPVDGYRAASFSVTEQSRWALDIIAQAGFRYDSSIFPVRHDLYGMPAAPRFAHRLTTPGGLRLIELPPTTVRLFGQNLSAAGGGYFRFYPYAFSRWLLRRVNGREGQPGVFYMHPWEIDPQQPRVNVGWRSRFRHYNNLDKCEARLRRLLGDFRMTTCREVLTARGLWDEPAA